MSLNWLNELTLTRVVSMLKQNGVEEILIKFLASNDNSKNQIYLAGDMSQVGKIPSGEVSAHLGTSEKSKGVGAVFRAPLKFGWLNVYGEVTPAIHAKLIFYPQFPEVRLSGFLRGCSDAPSELFDVQKRGREPGRVLVLGIKRNKEIVAIVLTDSSPAANELRNDAKLERYGALHSLVLDDHQDDPLELFRLLCRIHGMGFVSARRLDPLGNVVPCTSSNCNGNTLEALLGIRSNGFALPDLMGWEVKARTVAKVSKPGASTVTLFTPEPSGGIYRSLGLEAFLNQFGYPDSGNRDRINFGGVYRNNGAAHARTGLRLRIEGFRLESPRTFSADGGVELVDAKENIAMQWSFAKLLEHWKNKHAKVVYVPCEKGVGGPLRYQYGRNVVVGLGADFSRLLELFAKGKVYYDPGIKMEGCSTGKPKSKRRSQFRIKSSDIPDLYEHSGVVDVCDPSNLNELLL